jgi:hypothetical protein
VVDFILEMVNVTEREVTPDELLNEPEDDEAKEKSEPKAKSKAKRSTGSKSKRKRAKSSSRDKVDKPPKLDDDGQAPE